MVAEIGVGGQVDAYIRLNKFISNAGLCSRRRADELIKAGFIAVDGSVVRTVGLKIAKDAVVTLLQGGDCKVLKLSKESLRYVLLNKPKGYLTTMQDPRGRRTVMQLISKRYCRERIYPVGRLDYNTTGLLLLTNDGSLARQLMHPSSLVPKLYHAVLNKPICQEHIEAIRGGLVLEDGLAHVDAIHVVDHDPYQLGVQIHMGKNRIVHRIFNSLGYKLKQLDRVGYAHFTKKNIPRGHWIFLDQRQVQLLKQFVASA